MACKGTEAATAAAMEVEAGLDLTAAVTRVGTVKEVVTAETMVAVMAGGNYGNPGGYGNQNSFSPGFGGAGTCGGGMPGSSYGGGGGAYGGGYGVPAFGGYSAQIPPSPNGATGQPLGTIPQAVAPAPGTADQQQQRPPRIVPNPLDNKLIIQADAQQYQNILSILKELDVPPRQILLEAKIYEVDLNDQFSSGIGYSLGARGSTQIQTGLAAASGVASPERGRAGQRRTGTAGDALVK